MAVQDTAVQASAAGGSRVRGGEGGAGGEGRKQDGTRVWGVERCALSFAEPKSPTVSWDDPSWGPSGGWEEANDSVSKTADSPSGEGWGEDWNSSGWSEPMSKSKSQSSSKAKAKSQSGTNAQESGGWDNWGWDTADLRTAKTD